MRPQENRSGYISEEQRRILVKNKRLLMEKGFERGARHFRTTYDAYDANTIELMREYFELSFVGMGSATGTNLRVTDPSTIGFKGADDYAKARRLIDTAVEYNQLLGMNFHMRHMPSEEAFTDLVEYVRDYERRDQLAVITPSILLDEYLGG